MTAMKMPIRSCGSGSDLGLLSSPSGPEAASKDFRAVLGRVHRLALEASAAALLDTVDSGAGGGGEPVLLSSPEMGGCHCCRFCSGGRRRMEDWTGAGNRSVLSKAVEGGVGGTLAAQPSRGHRSGWTAGVGK
ncbi:hypothetical protein THAOC_07524, partial [Thalassiosira oceanica]